MRDGLNCFWCDAPTVEHGYFGGDNQRPDSRTLDHFIPKSKGGWNHEDNLVIACRACNWTRGNMLAEDWLEVLDARGLERAEKA